MSLHQAKAYVRHWLNEVDEHSIHSPFFFDFYRKVVRGTTDESTFAEVEKLRANLLANATLISVDDFGAGSAKLKQNKRTLADIARISISPRETNRIIRPYC